MGENPTWETNCKEILSLHHWKAVQYVFLILILLVDRWYWAK